MSIFDKSKSAVKPIAKSVARPVAKAAPKKDMPPKPGKPMMKPMKDEVDGDDEQKKKALKTKSNIPQPACSIATPAMGPAPAQSNPPRDFPALRIRATTSTF